MALKWSFPRRTLFRRRKSRNATNPVLFRIPAPAWTGETIGLLDRFERHCYAGPPHDSSDRPSCATEEEIDRFETLHGVRMPSDLRDYFLRLNGVEEAPELFRFWPLGEVRPVDLESFRVPDREHYFLIADYLIESFYYAIYLGNKPELQNWVVIPCMPHQPFVAITFTAFLELYLVDAPALYGQA
jgi:hypothetical protein